MKGTCLDLQDPIRDAISRVRFASQSSNLLISSWDSSLRLYDVDRCKLRVEAPTEAALIDCCFQDDSVAFSAGSDGSIRRYDFHSGIHEAIGNHNDLANCVEYSDETSQVITASWDKMLMLWDLRTKAPKCCPVGVEVESMSLHGLNLLVASGTSVEIYDLRNLSKSVHAKEFGFDVRVKCIRPLHLSEGFVIGSIDGRVALEYTNPSNSDNKGYVFWCCPKAKHGRHHLVAVNDIVSNASAFITGDNEGNVIAWDAQSKKRLFELPKCPNSVASLSCSHNGYLAVASSCTYQEMNEIEGPPQIFIYRMDDRRSSSVSSSSYNSESNC